MNNFPSFQSEYSSAGDFLKKTLSYDKKDHL